MNANGVNAMHCQPESRGVPSPPLPLDLEAGSLQGSNVVPQGGRGISATEDPFVQVDTPDEVLVLPGLSQTRQLYVHGAVILEHVVALAEKLGELQKADVLAHLELRDLVKFLLGNVTVVHAENAALLLGNTSGSEGIGGIRSTLFSNGNTGNIGAVVETGKLGKGTPAASDVKQLLALLELKLLANDCHLVVLQLLKSLLTSGVGDDTAGVDHARTEKPGVMVVAAVVVGSNLLHVLLTRVDENIASKGTQEELDPVPSEVEGSPVMTVLENVQQISFDVHFAIDVELAEGVDGNLASAAVALHVNLLNELQVGLNGATGQLGLLIETGAERRGPGPDDNEHREQQDNAEEDLGLESTANQAGDEPRNGDKQGQ